MLKRLIIAFIVYLMLWGVLIDRFPAPTLLADAGTTLAVGLALICAAGILWIIHRLSKQRAVLAVLKVGFGETTAGPSAVFPRRDYLLWGGVGLLIFTTLLCILERHQPFFFTQDDNFFIGQGLMIDACRSIFHGIFPAWNPYQYMGLPIASNPQSIFLYPPILVAYGLARFLFGNENYTNEIFAISQLLMIYVAAIWLLCRLNVRPVFAIMGSLALVFSGYSLILGRSWSNQPGYLLMAILLSLQTITLCEKRVGWKWGLTTGVIIGFFWYLGNAQIWVYALGLFLISLLLLIFTGSLHWRKALWGIPALCIGAAVAAPLVFPQLQETARIIGARVVGFGEGIEFGALSFLLPYPLSTIPYHLEAIRAQEYGPFAWHWIKNYLLLGHIFYSGTIFYLIAFTLLLFAFTFRFTRKVLAKNYWLLMALVTWVFALGPPGLVWRLAALLPVLGKMRGPFKLLGFLNLFVIAGACLVLERLVTYYRLKSWQVYGLFGVVSLLLLYHCALPLPAFYQYADRTFAPLPAQYQPILTRAASPFPQRIYSISPFRTPETGFVQGFNGDFASFYRIPTLNGYDPLYLSDRSIKLVQERIQADPYAAFKAYGVGWLVLQREGDFSVGQDQHVLQVNEVPTTSKLTTKILTLAQPPDPMAFANDDPRQALPIALRGDGALLRLPAAPACASITLNFTRQPFLKLYADGEEIPMNEDSWQRLHCTIPTGVKELRLAYVPPWEQGWLAAFLFALAASISCYFITRANALARLPTQPQNKAFTTVD